MSRLSTGVTALCTVLFNLCLLTAQETKHDASTTDFVPPRLVKEVRPVYPGIATEQGLDGEVILRVMVAKDGTVHDVKVVHGLPQLINSAVHAVSQWRFEPARVNGVALPSGTTVHVHFQVANQNAPQNLPPETQPTSSTVARPSLPPLPTGALRVSGRVMQQSLVKRVNPVYPPEGIPLDSIGDVVVTAIVNPAGEVQDVQALSGPPLFRQSATDAVKQWRFTPYLNEGQPVMVQTTITLHFEPPKL